MRISDLLEGGNLSEGLPSHTLIPAAEAGLTVVRQLARNFAGGPPADLGQGVPYENLDVVSGRVDVHRRHHVVKRLNSLAQRKGDRLRAVRGLLGRVTGLFNRSGGAVDVDDVALHFLGGLLHALGQIAYFIRDYGKAAAMFSGARRLDGGVQCQQVGLVSDLPNRLCDSSDGAHL